TLPTDHAGLSVKGAATPSPALLGGTVKFTLFVSNGGPGTATGVTLSDTQPAGVTIVSASASQGSCSTAAVIVCSLGTLLEGGTASVAVTVTASALGTITNVATVSGNEPDPDPSDSTVSTSVAVVLGADLSVRKLADADPAAVGTKLTYTVTVTNSGPGEASSVLLQDILPQAYVSFDSADSTQGDCSSGVNDSLVACNLGTIAPGAAAVVHIKVLVNYPGDLLNLVRVVANEPDSNWSNNLTSLRTKVEYICDLSVTKTAVPAKVEPGAAFGYHIVVKNNGPSPAGTVRISDTVPDGMAFDAPPGCSLSNRTITCLRFNVVVGGEATVDFSASAQSGPIVNTAKVALASGIDPNLLNNTSSVTEQIGSNSGNHG